jgi:cobalt transporter subunit CbtA
MFKRLLLAGLLAGLVSGLVLSAIQYLQVIPIIQEAERYETAATVHQEHGNDDEWSPQEGWERMSFTLAANVSMAIGLGLLLVGAYSLRQRISIMQGICWGAAGFSVFFIAPSLGLPPELPGAESGSLIARQSWWLLTVSCSAGGLVLLVFTGKLWLKLIGLLLLIIPHWIGAPNSGLYVGPAPESLSNQFMIATALANGVFWLVLGVASAWVYRRFEGKH